jgi:hypothetical protein
MTESRHIIGSFEEALQRLNRELLRMAESDGCGSGAAGEE